MRWNWQKADWPRFTYDRQVLEPLERKFLLGSGKLQGVFRHVRSDERDLVRIELISEEALRTSAIEGEFLNRDSLQSSIKQQLGLVGEGQSVPPEERGIAQMMADVYLAFAEPLSHKTMHAWHEMMMAGRRDI